jgi:NADH:ubiquinone oxidoreductase subunit F (NADH-binding)
VSDQRLLHGVGASRLSLADHEKAHGALPQLGRRGGEELLAAIEESGLRGRGGAHVATGMKLRALARRRRPVVVANGAESEPASAKDAVLLSYTPHLVLDGLVAASTAVGARDAILYVKAGGAFHAAAAALDERRGRDRVSVRLAEAPSRYVAGQETAAIAHLSGRPALPTTVPPRPFERGVDGRPTVVLNVETLAHVGLIVRHGPGWFRELGTDSQPGTALVTLSGAVKAPGVYEVAFHTPLATLIERAGGLSRDAQALLVGGYGGAWVSGDAIGRIALSEGDPLLRAGSIGSGVIVVLSSDTCGVHESARVLRYLADESAAQCGPCLYGLRAISNAFNVLTGSKNHRDVEPWLMKWSGDVTGRGACRHPDGAARFLESALRVFEDEIHEHRSGRCSATSTRPVLPLPVPEARAA